MKTTRKPKVTIRSNSPRKGPRQAPSAPPRGLTEFCGIISPEEAEQMIRDIEEAFEKIDAE